MLTIVVPGVEMFDEQTQEFVTRDDVTLHLEHSLVSLSKWESIHEKAFLGQAEKTTEEVLDYVKCMTLTPNVPDPVSPLENITLSYVYSSSVVVLMLVSAALSMIEV